MTQAQRRAMEYVRQGRVYVVAFPHRNISTYAIGGFQVPSRTPYDELIRKGYAEMHPNGRVLPTEGRDPRQPQSFKTPV